MFFICLAGIGPRPETGGVARRPQSPVGGIHQALAPFIQSGARALLIHGVAKRQAIVGVGKTDVSAETGCTEGILTDEQVAALQVGDVLEDESQNPLIFHRRLRSADPAGQTRSPVVS